nr:MAG TPA: Middle operon regulator, TRANSCRIPTION.2A [Caudoviricetes sp.]
MQYKPWMDYIQPEDMPNDDLKFIAENAGIKPALALIFCTPGLTVNIPKNAFKTVKERYIVKKYDGTKYSLNRLAIDCELSQRYIYKIIKKHIAQKTS